jgi:hypothetical protein
MDKESNGNGRPTHAVTIIPWTVLPGPDYAEWRRKFGSKIDLRPTEGLKIPPRKAGGDASGNGVKK